MELLIVVVIAFFIYQKFSITDAAAELNEKHSSEVIMYTTSSCGYCKKARILLDMQGVKYKDFDIEKSNQANAEMKLLGGHRLPVFLFKMK